MKRVKRIVLNIMYMIMYTFKFSPMSYVLELLEIIWDNSVFIDLYFSKAIIDELSISKNYERVVLLITFWAGINVFLLSLRLLEYTFYYEPYSIKMLEKENRLYEKIDSNIDYWKLENGSIQDKKNQMRRNIYLSNFAFNPIGELISSTIKFVGYSYIIFTLHPIIIVFFAIITILGFLISKRRNKVIYEYQKRTEKTSRIIKYLFNVLISFSYAKEVRINNAAKWLLQKLNNEVKNEEKFIINHQKKEFCFGTIEVLSTLVQTIVLYLYCIFSAVSGKITIGEFTLYIASITSFSGVLVSLVQQVSNLGFVSDNIDVFREYLLNDVSTHLRKGIQKIKEEDNSFEIEFKNVSFKYPESKKYALKNVSIVIHNKEKLSLIGFNGAGKSTFIKLLCRIYEPSEGEILLNGKNISLLDYNDYQKIISVVFQDFNVYSLSIKENICLSFGNNAEKLKSAINLSGLQEKIEHLRSGTDTQVGKEFDENGVEFSGGEAQKLATARAYFKDSPILIFDEPTASLDPFSESRLYALFNDIVKDKTAIFISHRLGSVKICDKAAVFNNGTIINIGTHEELVNTCKEYKEMFLKQATYYQEDKRTQNGK